MSFTRTPPRPETPSEFVAAATVESKMRLVPETPILDPEAKPVNGINLRLNEYELDLLRRLAASEDRSIQKTIKRLLIPAAEAALR